MFSMPLLAQGHILWYVSQSSLSICAARVRVKDLNANAGTNAVGHMHVSIDYAVDRRCNRSDHFLFFGV